MSSLPDFARQIQALFQRPIPLDPGEYLDLGKRNSLSRELLATQKATLPQPDPLATACEMLLESLHGYRLERARIALNEILKAYLNQISPDNQEPLTQLVVERLQLVFAFSLMESFPFANYWWDYLTKAAASACLFLLHEGLEEACHLLLDHMAEMGRQAAQRGLHTRSMQHFLRNLELGSQKANFPEIAVAARHHRFNLEVF